MDAGFKWYVIAQLFCQVHLDTSLFEFAKLWSPGSYLAILPNWIYLFASPLCQITKSTVASCQVCVAQSAFQSCQLYITKGNIAKLPSPNSRIFGAPWTSTHQCTMKDGWEIWGRVLKGLFQICYFLLMVVDSSSYWSFVQRRTPMMLCSWNAKTGFEIWQSGRREETRKRTKADSVSQCTQEGARH